MDNVTISPVAEWSTAIHNLDLERVQALLNKTPDLLWESIAIPESEEHAYIVEQLERYQLLGNTLTNLAAIPYILLDFDDEIFHQLKRTRLFEFLLSSATPDDLDTRSWGTCGNKTMHLAAFMGHGQPELVAHGASISVSNDLGHLPPKTPRFVKKQPNIRLRNPIEKSKSGSQEEWLKHQTQRKQDIDLLSKRSAVKNNPLFKKFEQQQQPSSTSPQFLTLGVPSNDKVDLIRKNSKVINSLKTKSYVTSSVFRQNAATATAEPRSSPTAAPRKKKSVPEAAETFDSATQPSLSISNSEGTNEPPLVPTQINEETAVAIVPATGLAIKEEPKDIGADSPILASTSKCENKPRENKVVMPPLTIVTTPGVLARPDSPTLEPESHQELIANHNQNESQRPVAGFSQDATEETDSFLQETKNDEDEGEDEDGSLNKVNIAKPGSPQQAVLKEQSPTKSSSAKSSPHFTHPTSVNNIPQSIPSTPVACFSEACLEKETKNYHERTALSPKVTSINTTFMSIESQPLERETPLVLATMDRYGESKIGFDHWYESYEEWDDGLYEPPSPPPQSSQIKCQSVLKEDLDESSIASGTPPASFSPQQRLSIGAESVDTLPPPSVKDDDITGVMVTPLATSSRGEDYGSISVQSTSFYANDMHSEEAPSILSDSCSARHSVERLDSGSDSDSDSVYSYIDTKVEVDDDVYPEPGPSVDSPESHDLQPINLDFQEMPPLKLDDRFIGETTMPVVDDNNSTTYQSTGRYDDRQNQKHDYAEDKSRDLRHKQSYNNTAYQSAGKYDTYHDLDIQGDEPGFNQCYNYDDEYRPPSVKLELPEVVNHPGQSTSAFGKLYVRVSSAENILLPLPNEAAYVRTVVSDGEYEFMSRYEELGPKVLFDYECIMDARPDMIVTLAIHVRPDSHVKPKTGLTKWFAPTYYNQREMLAGYVHPDDGAIGQSRFALGHMIQACNQKVYGASFDCFNSWYARTSRERHREQLGHDDILKVVASLSIEMLYLPVMDPSLPVPQNLRECDLALRIRQWHNTCWHNGYLSIRHEDEQVWKRHYCRLIGGQLLGYASKTASSWESCTQYNISDALRLEASSDQIVMALVDDHEESHKLVFQSDSIVQETRRGYFRITFEDTYIDFVSDELKETEAWVNILRSMIGRVPLKMPLLT